MPFRLGRDRAQFGDVVEAQQAAIGNHDHALDRKPFEHRRQHRLQRFRLGNIAGMHRVHEWQPLGRLNHAEHELARDAAGFLVHAVGAQIVRNVAFTVNPDRGQIIEHHRQL